MLQNAPYHIRFIVTLILAIVLSALFQQIVKRLLHKMRPIRSLTAISLRLGAFVLALWLVCMAALTLGTVQYVFKNLTNQGLELAQYVYRVGGFGFIYSSDAIEGRREIPGIVEYSMNEAIRLGRAGVGPPSYDSYPGPDSSKPLNIFRDDWVQCETAVLFLDKDSQIVRQSGDFVYFWYMSEDDWNAESDVTTAAGWIDLGDEADTRYAVLRTTYAGNHSLFDIPVLIPVLRLTGYFDGSRFEPLAMALMTDTAVWHALDSLMPDEEEIINWDEIDDSVGSASWEYEYEAGYTYSGLDAMGLIEWDVRFDRTAEAEPGQELVTIYAKNPVMFTYKPEGPVNYQGTEKYENLLALLGTMGGYAGEGQNSFYTSASKFDLWDLIVFSNWKLYDNSGGDVDYGQSHTPEYTVMTALRASPIRIAMGFLRNVYLVTFAMALIGFLLIRGSIKKNLTAPLREINEGIASGWTHLSALRESPPKWEEPHALAEHYLETQDTLRMRKNEIERLGTALDYAKSAEQNRRQMTSNIAHELKTPLAVVHSYAEGLKEHIAEEKRDKYLDVILSETERMDRMVLEMLDLSRLEAGKVKLARDDFSLTALARSILEKLEMAAQAKGLQVDCSFPGEFMVAADEGRIAQAIENFATNAIKYTPAGGHVAVKIQSGRSGTVFAIENESEPLSAEALGKVWDTFYRTDESRSGGGTGLGLAIAKNIVELHGGRCAVRNTETGVEFSFTI